MVRQQFALDTVRLSGAHEVLAEVARAADVAIATVEKQLPQDFPAYIHEAVKAGLTKRLKNL